MPPLPADFIHARACKLKCEKILTRPDSLSMKAHQKLIFCELFLIVQRTCIFNLYDTGRVKEGGWPHSGSG